MSHSEPISPRSHTSSPIPYESYAGWNGLYNCCRGIVSSSLEGVGNCVSSIRERVFPSAQNNSIDDASELLMSSSAQNFKPVSSGNSCRKYIPLAVSSLGAITTLFVRIFKNDLEVWEETALEGSSGFFTSSALLDVFSVFGGGKITDEAIRWMQTLSEFALFRLTQIGANHESLEEGTTSSIIFLAGAYLGATVKGMRETGFIRHLPDKIQTSSEEDQNKQESLFSHQLGKGVLLGGSTIVFFAGGAITPSSYKVLKVVLYSLGSHTSAQVVGMSGAYWVSKKIESSENPRAFEITDKVIKTLSTPCQMVLGIVVGSHSTSRTLEIVVPNLLAFMGLFKGYVGACQDKRIKVNPKGILPELRSLGILPKTLAEVGRNQKTFKALVLGAAWFETVRFAIAQIVKYHDDKNALAAMTALGVTSFLGMPLTYWVTATWKERDSKIKTHLFSFLNINFPGIEPAVLYGIITSLMMMNDSATMDATKIDAALIGIGWGSLGLAIFMPIIRLIREGSPLQPANLAFLLSFAATLTIKLRD